MADCTFLEQSFSHFIPELAGSVISTVLIAVCLLVYDWRMALSALWVLPVSFAIVAGSARVQERLNQKAMDAKMACADGIQECIETVQDLKANNAEQAYLRGLEKKIRAVERRSITVSYTHLYRTGSAHPPSSGTKWGFRQCGSHRPEFHKSALTG